MSLTPDASRSSSRADIGGGIASAIAVLAALLLAVGSFSVLPPLQSRPGLYLADRNLGLAALILVLLGTRHPRAAGAVLMSTAAMHLVDGVGDLAFGNLPASIGSIVVAIASGLAALRLLNRRDRISAGQSEGSLDTSSGSPRPGGPSDSIRG